MTALGYLILGIVGALAAGAVVLLVASRGATASSAPPHRRVIFFALLAVASIAALNLTIAVGGDVRVVLALSAVGMAAQAVRIVVASRRAGERLAPYAAILVLAAVFEGVVYFADLRAALRPAPEGDTATESDRPW